MTMLIAGPPRGPGRIPLEDDPARRARNLRWFFVASLGFTAESIAAGEPTPLHPRTVRRGAAAGRLDFNDRLAANNFDFAPSPSRDRNLDLKNATSRRRHNPRKADDR